MNFDIGVRLKAVRKTYGRSQRQLTARSGITGACLFGSRIPHRFRKAGDGPCETVSAHTLP